MPSERFTRLSEPDQRLPARERERERRREKERKRGGGGGFQHKPARASIRTVSLPKAAAQNHKEISCKVLMKTFLRTTQIQRHTHTYT
jgi:hypothetical protein